MNKPEDVISLRLIHCLRIFFKAEKGIFKTFSKGWVGVDGSAHVFCLHSLGYSESCFADKRRSFRTYDMDAKQTVIFLRSNNFDKSVCIIEGLCHSVPQNARPGILYRNIAGLSFVFRYTGYSDFRVAEDAPWHMVRIDDIFSSKDMLDCAQSVLLCQLGEHHSASNVYDGIFPGII